MISFQAQPPLWTQADQEDLNDRGTQTPENQLYKHKVIFERIAAR